MFNYQLAKLCSDINVAKRGHFKYALVSYSKLNINVLKLLYKNGVIGSISNYFDFRRGEVLKVILKYYMNKVDNFKIEIVSRPGRRVYWNLFWLNFEYSANKGFVGFYVVSTQRGLLTSIECMQYRMSGEVLLKVTI